MNLDLYSLFQAVFTLLFIGWLVAAILREHNRKKNKAAAEKAGKAAEEGSSKPGVTPKDS